MRTLLGVLALLATVSTSSAAPKDEALQVIERWSKAFADADVNGIVNLYAPNALFIGTSSKAVVTSSDGVRKYFEAALLANRPRTATLNSSEVYVIDDKTVAVSGLDTVTGTKDGQIVSASGRVTFVVAKLGDGWSIVQFHRSAMPN